MRGIEQFSDDIQRYLSGLPILARKATIRYRSVKFLRRHPVGVFVCALLLIGLLFALYLQVRTMAQDEDRGRASRR